MIRVYGIVSAACGCRVCTLSTSMKLTDAVGDTDIVGADGDDKFVAVIGVSACFDTCFSMKGRHEYH